MKLTDVYELMLGLDSQIARREQVERLLPMIPKPLLPKAAEIFELLRQQEAFDERLIDLIARGVNHEDYERVKAWQDAWLANIKAKVAQFAKDAKDYK